MGAASPRPYYVCITREMIGLRRPLFWDARGRVSAKADTRHEVPRQDDFNRLNSYGFSISRFQSLAFHLTGAGFARYVSSGTRLRSFKTPLCPRSGIAIMGNANAGAFAPARGVSVIFLHPLARAGLQTTPDAARPATCGATASSCPTTDVATASHSLLSLSSRAKK